VPFAVQFLQACYFASLQRDARVLFDTSGHFTGEKFTVYGQRLPGGHFHPFGHVHDQAAKLRHFEFQEADAGFKLCRAKGVGADQFGQVLALMRRREALRLHFIENDIASSLGQLPGGFASGQSGSDNCVGFAHLMFP